MAAIQPFYLVPRQRYVYLPPANFRMSRKSDVHKKSSPFCSMWYIWGGNLKRNNELFHCYQRWMASNCDHDAACDIARSKSALRDLRRKPR
jgi:hypothetical protein